MIWLLTHMMIGAAIYGAWWIFDVHILQKERTNEKTIQKLEEEIRILKEQGKDS